MSDGDKETDMLDELRTIAEDAAEAYERMLEGGRGIGALGRPDREAITKYEDAFGRDGLDAVLALLDVAEAFHYELAYGVGVDDLCSGLSITEYGCAGCPAHNGARALAHLGDLR